MKHVLGGIKGCGREGIGFVYLSEGECPKNKRTNEQYKSRW